MKFSVIIPAHNEEPCIGGTLEKLFSALEKTGCDFEIVVVSDHCADRTDEVVNSHAAKDKRIILVKNESAPGFGMAVRAGFEKYTGGAAAIYMADASDSPDDLCEYFRRIENGAECVFGSRFIEGSRLVNYPRHKLLLNRLVNWWIKVLFRHRFNDTTNAFKAYKRCVIDGCRPFLSPHFNLTVELPLKAVIRGYKFEVMPISWQNREHGISNLKIKEMGSRYLFIILYCLLEKWLTGKDYKR